MCIHFSCYDKQTPVVKNWSLLPVILNGIGSGFCVPKDMEVHRVVKTSIQETKFELHHDHQYELWVRGYGVTLLFT